MAIDYGHAQNSTAQASQLGGAITKAVEHSDIQDRLMQRQLSNFQLQQFRDLQATTPQQQPVQQQGGGGFYDQGGGGQQGGSSGTSSNHYATIKNAVHEELAHHDEQPRTRQTEQSLTDRIEEHENRPESPTQTPADQQQRIYRDLFSGRVKMSGGSNA